MDMCVLHRQSMCVTSWSMPDEAFTVILMQYRVPGISVLWTAHVYGLGVYHISVV